MLKLLLHASLLTKRNVKAANRVAQISSARKYLTNGMWLGYVGGRSDAVTQTIERPVLVGAKHKKWDGDEAAIACVSGGN